MGFNSENQLTNRILEIMDWVQIYDQECIAATVSYWLSTTYG